MLKVEAPVPKKPWIPPVLEPLDLPDISNNANGGGDGDAALAS